MNINTIGERLRTQDNRRTDQPMFVIERERFEYGYASEHADNHHWYQLAENYEIASAGKHEKLDKLCNNRDSFAGWKKSYYKTRWEFVTVCFTLEGCKDYMDAYGQHLGKTRINVCESRGNAEYRAVRDYLIFASNIKKY